MVLSSGTQRIAHAHELLSRTHMRMQRVRSVESYDTPPWVVGCGCGCGCVWVGVGGWVRALAMPTSLSQMVGIASVRTCTLPQACSKHGRRTGVLRDAEGPA